MKKLLIFIFSVCLIIPCMLLFSACANDPIQYKLSFVVDGEVYAVVDTAGEESISMPQNPTKDGYTFDGWYWDNETWQRPFTSNSLLNEPLSSDMKVYAKWRNDETLRGTQASFASFTKVDDTTYSIVLPNATELLNFSEVVEVNNKTSWKLTTDIYGNNSIASKIATLEPGDNVYYVLVSDEFDNVKLYTLNIRRKPLYTVSYYNGFGELHTTQQIEEDSIIETLPTAPEKLGYTFNSWDFDFETKIEEDRSIEATWDLVHYTITYNLDGGTNNDQNPVTYTIEDKVILQKPTKEGYTFYYWQNDDSRVGGITVGTTGDKVFDAVWLKHYNITCHLFGGEINKYNEIRPYYIITDEFYLGSPTKDGYTFDGWYYDENFNNKVNYNYFSNRSGGDVDLYAKFIPIEYKITYELYGGTKHISNPIKYTIEDEILLSVATKDNYDFLGWFSDSGLQNRVIKIEKGTKGDITLYAKFTPTQYSITYNLDNGENSPNNPTTYSLESASVFLSNPTKQGYTFLGWYDKKGNKVTSIKTNQYGDAFLYNNKEYKNIELTAKWQVINYKIYYTLNGGTNSELNPTTYTIETETFSLSASIKDNYDFVGWYTESAFKNRISQITKGSYGNIYIYAKYTPTTYTITYEMDGGTNNDLNPTTYNVEDNIQLLPATKSMYEFLGWFVGNRKITTLNSSCNQNLTLTAKWQSIFNMSGTNLIEITDYGKTLQSITIPNNVTSIGSSAFYDCSNLKKITIPDSVTSIGYGAFQGCSNLTSITIPNSVTSIGSAVFDGCTNLKNTIGNLIYIRTTDNPYFALYRPTTTTLTSATINLNCKFILDYAFDDCSNLTSLEIPSGVINIGYYAFRGCTYLQNQVGNIIYIKTTNNPYFALYGVTNTYLTSVTINSNCKFILDSALKNCLKLQSVIIPEGVISICGDAFSGCSNMQTIAIPNTIISIDSSSFYGCTSLDSFISDGIYTTLDNGNLLIKGTELIAFAPYGLTMYTIPSCLTSIGSNVFYGCSNLTSITIPRTILNIGRYAFRGCSSLTNITIPNGVTAISDYVFADCSKLQSIIIPNNVKNIGKMAFFNCSDLINITIPNSVITIRERAFDGCKKLQSIVIPSGVKNIEYGTFYNCSSLTSITIPNTVINFSDYAFYGCTNIKYIIIPNSVKSIGDYAFKNCWNLQIAFKGTEEEWNSITKDTYWKYGCNSYCHEYFYSENEPTLSGKYWHYGDNGEIEIW